MKDVSDQEMARECLAGFDRPTVEPEDYHPHAMPRYPGCISGVLLPEAQVALDDRVGRLDVKMREVMEQVARLRTDVLDCRVELKQLAHQYELLRAQVKAHESELQPSRVVLLTPDGTLGQGRSPMR